MRVAVATWSNRCVGGVEEYVSILLPALAEAGVEVAMWHELERPGDRPPIPVPDGVGVWSAAALGLDESLRRLRAWRPDIIYVQGLATAEAEAALLEVAPAAFFAHSYAGTCISGNKTTTRPVATACERRFGRACLAHYLPRGCGGSNPLTMWRLFKRQAGQLERLGRYRAVLTHTRHMRRELGRHEVTAHVVPFPIRASQEMPKTAADGWWRLLFAGRMDFLKGGAFLLDALPAIATALDRRVRLTFAGDGQERSGWERRAAALQARSPQVEVAFTGWLSQERLARLIEASDLLVVPSLWPEPFGSIGPQAARHGVPAAAFASGGIPEWLEEGVAGHLAPCPPTSDGLAGAVVRCLSDAQHHRDLQEGARQSASRFTLERHVPALLSVLAGATGAR